MGIASIPPAIFKVFAYLEIPSQSIFKEAISSIQKIARLAIHFFPPIQGGWYVGYGVKVCLWDGLRERIKKRAAIDYFSSSLQGVCMRVQSIRLQTAYFSFLYGASTIAAGGCGIIGGIGRLSSRGLSSMVHLFSAASRGFFLFGDLLSLQYYVDLFFEASELANSISAGMRLVAFKMKISAGLGIFICFSYLLASAVALLGGPIGVAFAVGCVGGMTSCLKGLFDFFYQNNQTGL